MAGSTRSPASQVAGINFPGVIFPQPWNALMGSYRKYSSLTRNLATMGARVHPPAWWRALSRRAPMTLRPARRQLRARALNSFPPAGWLPPQCERPAHWNRDFSSYRDHCCDGAAVCHHDIAIAQHCNTIPPRVRGITAFFCRRSVVIVRHCNLVASQLSGIVTLRCYDASQL